VTTVSVVIPAYNVEGFIGSAIESAWRQTLRPTEVLVVDDGSSDATREVAERAGAKVLRTDRNGGPATARNVGVHAAAGDVVAFLDADDLWEPGHAEACVALLDAHPEAVLAFSLVSKFGGAEDDPAPLLPDAEPVDATSVLWEANPLAQSAAVVRRSALLAVGGYRDGMRLSEDYELWFRLAWKHPFICTHRRLVRYRVHAEQHSLQLDALYRSAWGIRHQQWRGIESRLNPTRRREVVAALHRGYERELRAAWHQRASAPFNAVLAQHDKVPEAQALYWRWRLLGTLLRPFWRIAASAYDRLPPSVRALR
jgi:hypothetical protein